MRLAKFVLLLTPAGLLPAAGPFTRNGWQFHSGDVAKVSEAIRKASEYGFSLFVFSPGLFDHMDPFLNDLAHLVGKSTRSSNKSMPAWPTSTKRAISSHRIRFASSTIASATWPNAAEAQKQWTRAYFDAAHVDEPPGCRIGSHDPRRIGKAGCDGRAAPPVQYQFVHARDALANG
jgi:hypothetical protein